MTCGMMLARFGFMTRAYKALVGPLETISMIPIRSFPILETDPTGPVGLHPSLGYFALPYIRKWANPYRHPRRGITESALQFVGDLWRPPRDRIAKTCRHRFAANVAGSLNAPECPAANYISLSCASSNC